MTPEEYQRVKEAEKEHLRKLKELKSAVRLLRRRNAVNQALGDMASGPQSARDVHEEMVEKLAIETAQKEARMEIALENAQLEAAEEATGTPTRSIEELEEEMLKERAKSLLKQIKLEMGTLTEAPASASSAATPKERIATPEIPKADKTLGRPAPPAQPDRAKESSPDAELPEKSIGRMKQ
jgi:hypothetical protein